MAVVIKRVRQRQEESRVKPKSTTTQTRRRTMGTKRKQQEEATKISRISLWEVDSNNDKAPISRGTIELTAEVVEELMALVEDGEEVVRLGVAIWNNESDNERAPAFRGRIKSPSEVEAERAEYESKQESQTSNKKRKKRVY